LGDAADHRRLPLDVGNRRSDVLLDAPLSALASVIRTDQQTLIGKLKAHGISATSQQSVHELSNVHGGGMGASTHAPKRAPDIHGETRSSR
jgi:hypothetical protein